MRCAKNPSREGNRIVGMSASRRPDVDFGEPRIGIRKHNDITLAVTPRIERKYVALAVTLR